MPQINLGGKPIIPHPHRVNAAEYKGTVKQCESFLAINIEPGVTGRVCSDGALFIIVDENPPALHPHAPNPSLGPKVTFIDPLVGLESCVADAKKRHPDIKLHIALTHLGGYIYLVYHA